MKGLFLFNQEIAKRFRTEHLPSENEMYQFFPWSFGPFSKDVYTDLDFLMSTGFIRSEIADSQGVSEETTAEVQEWESQTGIDLNPDSEGVTEYAEEKFSLTDLGSSFVTKSLLEETTEAQISLLVEFKRRLCGTPLRAILRYVYQTYPKYATKSELVGIVVNK